MTHVTISRTYGTTLNAEEQQSLNQMRSNVLSGKKESGSASASDLDRINTITTATPVNIVFVSNILLCSISIALWLETKSFIVLSIFIYQACDATVAILTMYTQYSMKQNMDKFPAGRSRLECVGIVGCSMLMIEISISVIYFASTEIYHILTASSHAMMDVSGWCVAGMIFSVILKLTLWLFCGLFAASPPIVALSIKCRNDMFKVCVAFIAVCIIFHFNKLIWLDPIGGILVSFFFVVSWYSDGLEEVNKLIGIQAADEHMVNIRAFIRQEIKCDDYLLVAYHIGKNLLIEVKLILSDHVQYDLCNDLQQKLEEFKFIERAFVSFDCIKRDMPLHKMPCL